MLLSEPPRSPMDLNFALFGVPVRVHPLFWLTGVILNMQSGDNMVGMLLWLVAFFLSILVHELGHAAAMRAYGFYPWISLHALGGATSYNPAHDVGARSSSPWARIRISAAGPLAGFALAAVILLAIRLTGHEIVRSEAFFGLVLVPKGMVVSAPFTYLIRDILFTSIFWGILNLLPVFPLDGGQISRELFSMASPHDGMRQSLMLSILTAVVLAVVAVVQWNSLWSALFFGFLAYESYTALQFFGRRDPW